MITMKNTSIQFLPSTDSTYENRYYSLQAEQSQMLSRISHDLLDSLTMICCSYQFIESQHPEAASFRYWSDMKSDTDYIQHYLTSLSMYNHAAKLRLRSFDLVDLLHKAIKDVSVNYPEHAKFLSQKIDQICLPYCGDDRRLSEAFRQTLTNAFEAIQKKPQDESPKISVGFIQKNDFYEISICDNADGIGEESLPHICDPFFTEKSHHVGLGLPICRRILCAHNGHLDISSQKGRGTLVTLCLPITQMEMPNPSVEACQTRPLRSYHLS